PCKSAARASSAWATAAQFARCARSRSTPPGTAAASSAGAADPVVVAELEPLEQLDKQLGAIELEAALDEQRRRRPVDFLRQLGFRDVDVDPQPEHDAALTRLGEHPGHLAVAEEDV